MPANEKQGLVDEKNTKSRFALTGRNMLLTKENPGGGEGGLQNF
jgi:hypothetical protein